MTAANRQPDPIQSSLQCYQLEHEEHYARLFGEMPESVRRIWIAFVESTASHVIQNHTTPETVVGTRLPSFESIRKAVNPSAEAAGASLKRIVIGFSFGATFPFCSLAFRYLKPIWSDFLAQGAGFICLFPPESSPTGQGQSEGAIPSLVDEEARWASHCQLRMPLEKQFHPLSEILPWFPGYTSGKVPDALTLPGTCIADMEGRIRDIHLPGDVTNRLPPPKILERLQATQLDATQAKT